MDSEKQRAIGKEKDRKGTRSQMNTSNVFIMATRWCEIETIVKVETGSNRMG